jgi:outer membrane biosynthesis protein TonB
MIRIARIALTVSALSLGLGLAGCESFDPTSIFDSDFFSTKKKLQGERRPVFPEGTPGVQQGVPPELVKGYQPTEQAEPSVEQTQTAEPKPEAKPKPKPKPKVVAKPKPDPVTTQSTQAEQPQQAQQTQWPDPPRQPTAGGFGSAQPSGQVAWPDPPAPR